MVTSARINPRLLAWMRERAGLDQADAAAACGVKAEQLAAWEAGEAAPTFRPAQKLAAALHAPLGYLFLSVPPAEPLPIPDLRTLGGAVPRRPSLDLQDTIREALQRQDWYAEHLREQQGRAPLEFVGRWSMDSPPERIADDLHATLGVDIRSGSRRSDDYHRELITAAERCGVLVMRSGIVAGNTHRALDVAEFRGFAIAHPQAPLVFVNSADAPAARLFTLVHELAHLWVGSSGVSDAQPGSHQPVEVLCNAVAGEFLAPRQHFTELWQAAADDPMDLRIARVAKALHVSTLVVMRRALDLGLVSAEAYRAHYLAELHRFRDQEGSGGSYYRTLGAKNSERFARAVLTEALSGRLLLRDAGRLLGMQPSKLRRFAEVIGV